MHSFTTDTLERLPLSHDLLRIVGQLREAKGREAFQEQRAPELLETLHLAALVASTAASNRIEGVYADPARLLDLLARKAPPLNRSEQEIAGYRDVLSLIHARHDTLPFSYYGVLQLHLHLFRYTRTEAGRWKTVDNAVVVQHPDTGELIRWEPVPAGRTHAYMERLHERFDALWLRGDVDPLLLIPAYVFDFLCIRPFDEGNGRMARLITLLLLYRAGFGGSRYISLERLIEET
jgi:Fic family protein